MNSLPALAEDIKAEMSKMKSMAMLLQKHSNKQIKSNLTFLEFFYERKIISEIYPMQPVHQSTKSLLDLSNHIFKVFQTKHTQLTNLVGSINQIKGKSTPQSLQQAVRIQKAFNDYLANKFNVFKQMILEVCCKKVEMHMDVLQKKGIELTDKDQAILDIFGP